ncbi:hypothetical protein CesoFtcFv8_027360 [Champsocephalus esox]|uniref:Uncharacterized protein n=1 Tax=Champsocephalus esox TaxID=159716 RepID=A0AAN7YBZ4_9TELE|nr:hypothetical protein CesoFtcFv8_027360 [Champsocephalus esox]
MERGGRTERRATTISPPRGSPPVILDTEAARPKGGAARGRKQAKKTTISPPSSPKPGRGSGNEPQQNAKTMKCWTPGERSRTPSHRAGVTLERFREESVTTGNEP